MPGALTYSPIRRRRNGQEGGPVHKPVRRRIAGLVAHKRELDACYSERSTPQKSRAHKTARREVYQ
jgi:hypothetical protein